MKQRKICAIPSTRAATAKPFVRVRDDGYPEGPDGGPNGAGGGGGGGVAGGCVGSLGTSVMAPPSRSKALALYSTAARRAAGGRRARLAPCTGCRGGRHGRGGKRRATCRRSRATWDCSTRS